MIQNIQIEFLVAITTNWYYYAYNVCFGAKFIIDLFYNYNLYFYSLLLVATTDF